MELRSGLVCRGLAFRWPGKGERSNPVLQGVDAWFPPGSTTLVTGETGSGKTTLLHLLAGLLRPIAGEVRADDRPISRWPAHHRNRWRQQVGIVFQHLALISDLSVAENMLLRLLPLGLSGARIQRSITRQLTMTALAGLAATPTQELSGGQRQRLALARALVGQPRFVLADEPTAFQDDVHTDLIANLLETAATEGATVVICSHDPRLRKLNFLDRRYHLTSASLKLRHDGEPGR